MYHYRPSTYSPEPGEESSETFSLDTYLSGLARSRNTRETSSSNDSQTECSHFSRSGTTSALSTGDHGEDQLTFWPEDSLAKTCQPREQTTGSNKDLMEIALDFGRNTKGLLERFNLDLSLPRTPRIFEVMVLEPSCKTLPAWGMMLDGVCLEVATLARTTIGNDCGYLPTVLATDWKGGTTSIRKDSGTPRLDQWRHYVKLKFGMTYPHPTHSELRMAWPERWTDSGPLEMGKFQSWQLLHSPFLPGSWVKVSWSADCLKYDESDEYGEICSVCGGDYEDCPCPGPTQDGWEYEEYNNELYARPINDNLEL